MIICPPNEWRLSYLCPACGNLYFGSTKSSYTVFGGVFYSDGSRYLYGANDTWITKCPRCNQYFAKEYLFPLPQPIAAKDVPQELLDRPWRGEGKSFGHIDFDCTDGEYGRQLWENVVRQGLYFPVNAYSWDRKEYNIRAHKELWYQYNQNREEVSEETYLAHCRTLLGMLDERHTDTRLTLAELYRNIGDFEKCVALLESIAVSQKEEALFACIKAEMQKGNTRTVVVEQYPL